MKPNKPNLNNDGIVYSPLLDQIGKIEITENTSPRVISILMQANPHTVKINGKYV